MDYYKILDFSREPFSNSPDPAFFFQSRQHLDCLQKLEVALRLKRGLNVVLGRVGTGKTTLCRQLIQRFATDDRIETHLIFDPAFGSPIDFLRAVAGMFGRYGEEETRGEWQLKEAIKKYLFERGVDDKKTVVLIIDEGQKIPGFCLELLREFLNYETNEYKLLQIVIFAQSEFESTIEQIPNFSDRINLLHYLKALDFRDAGDMIRFRLKRASRRDRTAVRFTYPALVYIYRATGGYPRKIIHLCHKIVLSLIIQNRSKVTWSLVRSCVKRDGSTGVKRLRWSFVTAGACALFTWAIINMVPPPYGIRMPWSGEKKAGQVVVKEIAGAPEAKVPASYDDTADLSPASSGAKRVEAAVTPLPDPFAEKSGPSGGKPEGVEKTSAVVPEMIGRIIVKRGDIASRIISNIYGSFRSDYLDAVSKANPHIRNLDRIEVGQVVNLPAVVLKGRAFSGAGNWVCLSGGKSLEGSYEIIRNRPRVPALRLVPYWNSREGVKSVVIVNESFISEQSAESCIKSLSPEMASSSTVISGWDEGTMFFCEGR